jgi:membrane-associated phospholipid phosphatase
MDRALLTFFNQTLAHPVLDKLMLVVTFGGLYLLPGVVVMFWILHKRRIVLAVLAAMTFALLVTFVFQFAGLRPRPDHVRLITPQPDYPSYPSGHAALAFSAAAVLCLTYRQARWTWLFVTSATLITISRIYLGIHYPSDVIGGGVIGAAVGAACYGLIILEKPNWRWMLWPQIALIFIATQMAYLNILPRNLLSWPWADKVLHFLLFGALVFWLNVWLNGRVVKLWRWQLPLAVLIPLICAIAEEGAQSFSPYRTVDIVDLACDAAGMFFFWRLSYILLRNRTR